MLYIYTDLGTTQLDVALDICRAGRVWAVQQGFAGHVRVSRDRVALAETIVDRCEVAL